jgi:NDP-sugar pyrophosphorylase family protein
MLPVVVLAGGLATRVRPLTETIPKSMLDVNGKPFIHHQLSLLLKKGVSVVILCIGHLGEQIERFIGDGSNYQMHIEYSYDGDQLLGTGGAIKQAANRLPDVFFILYGDSYLDIDYQKVEDAYFSSGKKGLMTVFKNDDKWDSSNVLFENNEIIRYSKSEKANGMNYIDYGLGILTKSEFVMFPKNKPFDLSRVYERLSLEKQLAGYEAFERFYEIGSMDGLNDLRIRLAGA